MGGLFLNYVLILRTVFINYLLVFSISCNGFFFQCAYAICDL